MPCAYMEGELIFFFELTETAVVTRDRYYSVALNKTARQMSIELADKISYDIGGQYFTLQGLSSV